MVGIRDRADSAGPKPSETAEGEPPSVVERRELSPGLINSLALVLIGASIGVFWREVFQLTIRAIEAFR